MLDQTDIDSALAPGGATSSGTSRSSGAGRTTTRSASIVATESAEVARIGLNDFKALLDAHPELRARIEEMARRRLYSLQAASHN